MLTFDKLSFWEKVTFLSEIDFVIIGGGLVGLSTALSIKRSEKRAKVVVLERGYLSSGASTKNAGFSCFGSPSELLSDLKVMGKEQTLELLAMRWNGLQKLRSTIGDDFLNYEGCGSYDLFRSSDAESFEECSDQLDELNKLVHQSIGLKSCFTHSEIPKTQGMLDVLGSFYNAYDGAVHTGDMMHRLHQLVVEQGVIVLNGIQVDSFEAMPNEVLIHTNYGELRTKQLNICTNGFASKLLPDLDLKPARAQVLVTSPISDLRLDSTYHYDAGYYYFRRVAQNRVLIGGARNMDIEGETTDNLDNTSPITEAIEKLLRDVILPENSFQIEYKWAGIMGVGALKMPLIGTYQPRVHYALRLGGMGVAIGMYLGERLANLNKTD
jgi:gamma-glutamylputrescine oxidase